MEYYSLNDVNESTQAEVSSPSYQNLINQSQQPNLFENEGEGSDGSYSTTASDYRRMLDSQVPPPPAHESDPAYLALADQPTPRAQSTPPQRTQSFPLQDGSHSTDRSTPGLTPQISPDNHSLENGDMRPQSAHPLRPAKTPKPLTKSRSAVDAIRNLTPTFQATSARRSQEDIDRSRVRAWLQDETSTRRSDFFSNGLDEMSDVDRDIETEAAMANLSLYDEHSRPLRETSGLTTPESYRAWEDQVEGAWTSLIMPNLEKEDAGTLDPKDKGTTIKTLVLMLQLRESQAKEAARLQKLAQAEADKLTKVNQTLHKLVSEAENKIMRQRQALRGLEEENTHWRQSSFENRDLISDLQKENRALEDRADALSQEAASQRYAAMRHDTINQDSTMRFATAREENRKLQLQNQKLELEKTDLEKRNRVLIKQTALLRSSLSDLQAEEERSGNMWNDFQGIADRLMTQIEAMEEDNFKCIEEACSEKKQLQQENLELKSQIDKLLRSKMTEFSDTKKTRNPEKKQRKLRSSQSMPPNWMKFEDPKTGRPYFFNKETATSQWHPPPPPPAASLPPSSPRQMSTSQTSSGSHQKPRRSKSLSAKAQSRIPRLGTRSQSANLGSPRTPKENGTSMDEPELSESSIANAIAVLKSASKLHTLQAKNSDKDPEELNELCSLDTSGGDLISIHTENTKALKLKEAMETSFEAATVPEEGQQTNNSDLESFSNEVCAEKPWRSGSYSVPVQDRSDDQTLKQSNSTKSMPFQPQSAQSQR